MNEQVHYVIFDSCVNEYVIDEDSSTPDIEWAAIFNSVREASRSMTQADEEIHAVRVGTNGELIDLDRQTNRKDEPKDGSEDEPKDGSEDEPEVQPDFESDTRTVYFYGKTSADALRKLATWCSQNMDEYQEVKWTVYNLRPYVEYIGGENPYAVSVILRKNVSGAK